jgi:hypothetical protein
VQDALTIMLPSFRDDSLTKLSLALDDAPGRVVGGPNHANEMIRKSQRWMQLYLRHVTADAVDMVART